MLVSGINCFAIIRLYTSIIGADITTIASLSIQLYTVNKSFSYSYIQNNSSSIDITLLYDERSSFSVLHLFLRAITSDTQSSRYSAVCSSYWVLRRHLLISASTQRYELSILFMRRTMLLLCPNLRLLATLIKSSIST